MTVVDPVSITVSVIATIAAASSFITPWLLRRRKARSTEITREALTLEAINRSLQKDKEELQKQLNGIDERYRSRMKGVEEDFERRMASLQTRVTELEEENGVFRASLRALGQRP